MEDNKREKTLDELKIERDALSSKIKAIEEANRKRELEEKEKREVELAKQKNDRLAEIKAKEDELNNLYKKYLKDYGSIHLKHRTRDYDDFFNFLKYGFLY